MEPAPEANVRPPRVGIPAPATPPFPVPVRSGYVSVTIANSVVRAPHPNPASVFVAANPMPAAIATSCANNTTTAAKITTRPAYVCHPVRAKSVATTDAVVVAAPVPRARRVTRPGSVNRCANPIALEKRVATTDAVDPAARAVGAQPAPTANALPIVCLPVPAKHVGPTDAADLAERVPRGHPATTRGSVLPIALRVVPENSAVTMAAADRVEAVATVSRA